MPKKKAEDKSDWYAEYIQFLDIPVRFQEFVEDGYKIVYVDFETGASGKSKVLFKVEKK